MIASRPISEDDLHGYVDKMLDTERYAEVEAYLEQHPDVARRVQGFVRQREMLRATFAPIGQEPVPPELSLRRLIEAKRRPPANAWRSRSLLRSSSRQAGRRVGLATGCHRTRAGGSPLWLKKRRTVMRSTLPIVSARWRSKRLTALSSSVGSPSGCSIP